MIHFLLVVTHLYSVCSHNDYWCMTTCAPGGWRAVCHKKLMGSAEGWIFALVVLPAAVVVCCGHVDADAAQLTARFPTGPRHWEKEEKKTWSFNLGTFTSHGLHPVYVWPENPGEGREGAWKRPSS